MKPGLRQTLAPLHTWAGLLLGSLLFAIFWMGTLSVFDREIDRWMHPATRLAPPPAQVSLDAVLPQALQLAGDAPQFGLRLPSAREPVIRMFWRDTDERSHTRAFDPRSGALLPEDGSWGGTGFIFPFHFKLHIGWLDLGYWLVGLAGMGMLVLLVSGVVLHRRLLADFFLFRPRKQLQRASLDLHNLSGVLALPFHFAIALSGLVIFIGIYFPQSYAGAYGLAHKADYQREAFGSFTRPKSGQPGAIASLDALRAAAEAQWPGGKASFVRVWHPGDAAAFVEVRRSFAHDVTMHLDRVSVDAASGAVLHRFEAPPVVRVQRFLSGLHFIQFEHWTLRWLYFLGGLSGCVLIATGFLFWLEARRARHAKQGLGGVRLVEALCVASVSGIVLATLAFFVVNRLLPAGSFGLPRESLEWGAFYASWLLSLLHAARRPGGAQPARRAWREQCLAIALLALLAVLLNALSTADALPLALARGQLAVAGMDLLLLLGAAGAALTARRLREPAGALPRVELRHA